MRKFILSLVVLLVLSTSLPTDLVLAQKDTNKQSGLDEYEAVLFADSANEDVELFDSLNAIKENEPSVYIPDDTIVQVLNNYDYSEELDEDELILLEEYSLVQFIDEDTNLDAEVSIDDTSNETHNVSSNLEIIEDRDNSFQGFVHNSHIIDIEEADEFRKIRLNEVESEIIEADEETDNKLVKEDEEIVEDETPSITTFSLPAATSVSMTGLALKQPVHVYESENRNSKVLKSYNYGHRLKFRTHTNEWHKATVYIGGKPHSGYIHTSDVGDSKEASAVYGVALKKSTNVYSGTNRNSVLKSYKKGHILKYKAHNKDWFSASVRVNGKWQAGYIHKNDVETGISSPKTLHGVGIKQPTSVYQRATTSSKKLKSYDYGLTLKFKEFTSDWYEATVYVKGKPQKGYIRKSHTGSMNASLNGFALKNRVHVYTSTSKSSKSLKSYAKGSSLKYRPYNRNWFSATVRVNGKWQSGFIHAKDVGKNAPSLYGYAQGSPTHIYKSTSLGSKKIKSYTRGSKLKFKPHSKNWYRATVYVSGKWETGYIHKNNVTASKPRLNEADRLKTIDNHDQLILVTSKGYNTSRAQVKTFERTKNGNWKQVLSQPGHIGKNGFANNKREGDGKSPTGKYSIGTAFGQKGNPGTKLPFKSITSDDVWVDDPTSKLYNTWQSRKKTSGQWNSAENMNHRLYTYGFVINYNTNRTPYKGSAIFMHVGNSYTVGCTATNEKSVISMMKWLDPKKNPVIIQTPESALNKY